MRVRGKKRYARHVANLIDAEEIQTLSSVELLSQILVEGRNEALRMVVTGIHRLVTDNSTLDRLDTQFSGDSVEEIKELVETVKRYIGSYSDSIFKIMNNKLDEEIKSLKSNLEGASGQLAKLIELTAVLKEEVELRKSTQVELGLVKSELEYTKKGLSLRYLSI